MARAAVRCSVDQIAERSDVAPGTIRRLEKGNWPGGVKTATIEKLQITYESFGLVFVARNEQGVGVLCGTRLSFD